MRLDLNRVFIRNKKRYPIRVLVSISNNGMGKYRRIIGKSELGPLRISKVVYSRIAENPNIEVFNL